MGRLPVIQNDAGPRPHYLRFHLVVRWRGFKAGITYGATDEFGHHAVEKLVSHHDFHATLLHLFGLDAKKLIHKRGATELSLINGQAGKVVTDLLR